MLRRCTLCLLFLLTACGDSEGPDVIDDGMLSLALEASVTQTIVPQFQNFEDEALLMQTRVDALCETPDEARVEALQEQWRNLTRQWNRVAFYLFGPLDDDIIAPSVYFIESMRQRGTDYTNTVRETLAGALAGDEVLNDGYFEGLTFNRVGLLALEVLAFENSQTSTATADIASEYATTPRKCTYLAGVARLLAGRATKVRMGWDTNFADSGTSYADLFMGNQLPDGADPAVALLQAMVEHLDYIKVRKLDGILDAQLSGQFYVNVGETVAALNELMSQDGGNNSFGFFDVMVARGFQADVVALEAQLSDAGLRADATSRDDLRAVIADLETQFREAVPNALGIDLGINFSDGD